MSMTREEAILEFETMLAKYAFEADEAQAIGKAFEALRPVSREQVEKVWRGEWQMVSNGSGVCSECHRQDKIDPLAKFCRYCGAPMTDEAVQMVIERLEVLHGET